MEILRKSLKAYLLVVVIFALLTLALAAAVSFTGFKESWTFGGLVGALTLSSVVIGFFEGRIIGHKGIVTGIAAALLFLLIVLFSVSSAFESALGIGKLSIFYLIPIVGGAVGGIVGVSGAND